MVWFVEKKKKFKQFECHENMAMSTAILCLAVRISGMHGRSVNYVMS